VVRDGCVLDHTGCGRAMERCRKGRISDQRSDRGPKFRTWAPAGSVGIRRRRDQSFHGPIVELAGLRQTGLRLKGKDGPVRIRSGHAIDAIGRETSQHQIKLSRTDVEIGQCAGSQVLKSDGEASVVGISGIVGPVVSPGKRCPIAYTQRCVEPGGLKVGGKCL